MQVKDLTILIVEDDPNDVLLIRRAFKKAKIANPIQIVNDGEQAIQYLSGSPPFSDRNLYPMPILILLDLKLPRKSGFEVLEWLEQQDKVSRIPVVILTSSNQSGDINQAYDFGANSYLVKPVAFHDLVNLVDNLSIYWLVHNEKPEIA